MSNVVTWPTVRAHRASLNIIVNATIDSLAERDGADKETLIREFYKSLGGHQKHFQTLFKLRCRAAHPETPEKLEEWRAIQRYAAKRLGRAIPKVDKATSEKVLFGPDDLQLRPLEAMELKLILLRGASEGLRLLQPKE